MYTLCGHSPDGHNAVNSQLWYVVLVFRIAAYNCKRKRSGEGDLDLPTGEWRWGLQFIRFYRQHGICFGQTDFTLEHYKCTFFSALRAKATIQILQDDSSWNRVKTQQIAWLVGTIA
jgi:hypothetical protein